MGTRLRLTCEFLFCVVALSCSDSGSDSQLGQTQTGKTGGAAGADSGLGGTQGSGSSSGKGGSNTGGRAGSAASSASGGVSGGNTGGASARDPTGGVTGSSGGAAGSPGTGGNPTDAAADGSPASCGSQTCSSTRCAAWNCGAAVCCDLAGGRKCVHGTIDCPAADGGGDHIALQCWTNQPDAYAFDKSCSQKSDCFVDQHWMGCCNVHAIGMNVSETSRAASFEASCGGAPPCGCCCDRVTAEDGQVVSSGTTLDVECVAGVCRSRVP